MRVHYPSFRQGAATVSDLVEVIIHYLIHFALPRAEVIGVMELYGKIDAEDFRVRVSQLFQSAISLFKRANEATNRNGEAGELILYLMTEWVLEAPQLIAKMSLKTNQQMAVHGADGVHVRYKPETSTLLLYWGESKLYADVGAAIGSAVQSIKDALDPEKIRHELELVGRNIDFSGLGEKAKMALLRHLDPFDEASNQRHNVSTCLIGFDVEAFQNIVGLGNDAAEAKFCEFARENLSALAQKLSTSLKDAGLGDQPIEMFFFPVPSVQQLRDLFQAKIGWKA
jgi:Cap4 SAVED domain